MLFSHLKVSDCFTYRNTICFVLLKYLAILYTYVVGISIALK